MPFISLKRKTFILSILATAGVGILTYIYLKTILGVEGTALGLGKELVALHNILHNIDRSSASVEILMAIPIEEFGTVNRDVTLQMHSMYAGFLTYPDCVLLTKYITVHNIADPHILSFDFDYALPFTIHEPPGGLDFQNILPQDPNEAAAGIQVFPPAD